MRAVVLHSAGDLRVEDHAAPVSTGDGVRVRIEAGGICGSDLHYFLHGGFGAVRLREPMILGHEVAGVVLDAPASCDLSPGDRVAVSPSRPCGECRFCRMGMKNHCENMAFYGSAMPMPHIQGAFRDELIARVDQCHRIAPGVPVEIAAFAEPLSVVLHALRRAGTVEGLRVLITGCGPIGALALLAARAAGAGEVVVTDVMDRVLELAGDLGADRAINVASVPGWVDEYTRGKGHFDVMIEASGNQSAIVSGLSVLRPRGILVQLGLGGDVSLPLNTIVAKEIDLRGSFRFHEEFVEAVDALNTGRIDVAPLLTARHPVAEAEAAFRLAADRTKSMKVQLDFTT
jgi:L-idonate 5-dehydrogenase